MDRVAATAVFSLFSEWVFYFVTTGWMLEIGLCENSINSIKSIAWCCFLLFHRDWKVKIPDS